MPSETPGARGAQGRGGHRAAPRVPHCCSAGGGGAEMGDERWTHGGGTPRRAQALWRPHAAEAGTAPAPLPAARSPTAARSLWLPAYLLAVPCKLVSSVKLFLTLRKLAST